MNTSRTARRFAVALSLGIVVLGAGVGASAAPPDTAIATTSSAPMATDDREGPQFYSGVSIDVSGTIDGDVYASGQSITISGDVTGDVIAAAQTITVTGTVDGSIRLAGQSVTIGGEVSGSGTIFAADVTVADTASFGDDLVGASGTMNVAGDVGRDLVVSVGTLRIDGTVGGDVTYVSDNEARISEGAVSGTVDRIQSAPQPRMEISPWGVIVGWLLGLVYALVALSIVTALTALLVPRWLRRVTDHLMPSPWKGLLVGFVAAVAVPFVLLTLLITIVGAPIALALGTIWFVMTLATFPYVAHYLGRLLFRGNGRPVVESLVGGLILITALQVPWLNIVVWLAMVFFGLGAQLLEIHRQRPWKIERHTESEPAPVAESASAAEPASTPPM